MTTARRPLCTRTTDEGSVGELGHMGAYGILVIKFFFKRYFCNFYFNVGYCRII